MADQKGRIPTPPTGIQRAIRAGAPMVPQGEFDDESPSEVGKPPERRRATRGDINTLNTNVAALRDDVGNWVEVDRREHQEIRAVQAGNATVVTQRMDKVDTKLGEHDAKFDGVISSINSLAVESARTNALVPVLLEASQVKQKADAQVAATVEATTKELVLKDKHEDKSYWRDIKKKVVIGLIGIIVAVATIAVEHLIF